MKVINNLRIANMYIVAFCLLFLFQKYTLGLLPGIKKITLFNTFYFYELFFSLTSLVFILLFVRVELPSRRASKH